MYLLFNKNLTNKEIDLRMDATITCIAIPLKIPYGIR